MNALVWTLKFENVEHKVVLNRGINPRDPMSLTVDGKIIASQLVIPKSSIIAKLEYSFTCEDEKVLLVVYGNKADLVFRNKWQLTQKEYHSKNNLPIWVICLTIFLNVLAPILVGRSYISWLMTFSTTVLLLIYPTNPFYALKGKIARVLTFLLLNWLIAFSSFYLAL